MNQVSEYGFLAQISKEGEVVRKQLSDNLGASSRIRCLSASFVVSLSETKLTPIGRWAHLHVFLKNPRKIS